jgi:hypothetical protein
MELLLKKLRDASAASSNDRSELMRRAEEMRLALQQGEDLVASLSLARPGWQAELVRAR